MATIDVKEIEKFKIGPDDVLVVTMESHLSAESFHAVRAVFEEKFPGQVIVKTPGIVMEIYERSSPEAVEAAGQEAQLESDAADAEELQG